MEPAIKRPSSNPTVEMVDILDISRMGSENHSYGPLPSRKKPYTFLQHHGLNNEPRNIKLSIEELLRRSHEDPTAPPGPQSLKYCCLQHIEKFDTTLLYKMPYKPKSPMSNSKKASSDIDRAERMETVLTEHAGNGRVVENSEPVSATRGGRDMFRIPSTEEQTETSPSGNNVHSDNVRASSRDYGGSEFHDSKFKDGILPIPDSLQKMASDIRNSKMNNHGLPCRLELRKHQDFFYARGHLKGRSLLGKFYGDTRLFTRREWIYFAASGFDLDSV